MTIATRNGTKPIENSDTPPASGLSLGFAGLGNLGSPSGARGLNQYKGSSPGSAITLALQHVLGHTLTHEEQRDLKQAERQVLDLRLQASKLGVLSQEWTNVNQQVGINMAQSFALLTALKHLSSDPDYQAWWASWSKFEAERISNTTDDLLVVGARMLVDILAQPVQPPGELVAWWRSLFGQ